MNVAWQNIQNCPFNVSDKKWKCFMLSRAVKRIKFFLEDVSANGGGGNPCSLFEWGGGIRIL